MRVLFCISILAFAALLWASFAMARHVRQARRPHRKMQQDATTNTNGKP
jgi:hypothetical protein